MHFDWLLKGMNRKTEFAPELKRDFWIRRAWASTYSPEGQHYRERRIRMWVCETKSSEQTSQIMQPKARRLVFELRPYWEQIKGYLAPVPLGLIRSSRGLRCYPYYLVGTKKGASSQTRERLFESELINGEKLLNSWKSGKERRQALRRDEIVCEEHATLGVRFGMPFRDRREKLLKLLHMENLMMHLDPDMWPNLIERHMTQPCWGPIWMHLSYWMWR